MPNMVAHTYSPSTYETETETAPSFEFDSNTQTIKQEEKHKIQLK